ncbi:MAG: hypothetical protein WC076_13200 [Terrimicrobiaceae bacterium]|nr:DUF2207 domain-containing protein [Terrimicrobiaceae bacterium]
MVVPDSQRFGLLAVLGYFLASWTLVGRDPKRGVIIPLFAPPEGFTPQEVRYLDGLGTCDNTSLSAAILHLAVQRALTIQESTKGVYTLTKGKASGLDDAETRLLEALFTGGSSLKLVQQRHFVRFHRSRLQFRKRRRGLLGGAEDGSGICQHAHNPRDVIQGCPDFMADTIQGTIWIK